MRCWRITTLHEVNWEIPIIISFVFLNVQCKHFFSQQYQNLYIQGNDKYEETPECSLELSFEYLMAKDHLQWITISSEQAILMSVCLQSMIDELLLKNVGGVKNQEVTGKAWTYVTRDGYSRTVMGSPSPESFNKNTKVCKTFDKVEIF